MKFAAINAFLFINIIKGLLGQLLISNINIYTYVFESEQAVDVNTFNSNITLTENKLLISIDDNSLVIYYLEYHFFFNKQYFIIQY